LTDAWVPDTRVIPPELEDDYEHADFPPKPIHFVPLEQKLTGDEWSALKAYAQHASIGEPDASA